jgi:hypothetical protein
VRPTPDNNKRDHGFIATAMNTFDGREKTLGNMITDATTMKLSVVTDDDPSYASVSQIMSGVPIISKYLSIIPDPLCRQRMTKSSYPRRKEIEDKSSVEEGTEKRSSLDVYPVS